MFSSVFDSQHPQWRCAPAFSLACLLGLAARIIKWWYASGGYIKTTDASLWLTENVGPQPRPLHWGLTNSILKVPSSTRETSPLNEPATAVSWPALVSGQVK